MLHENLHVSHLRREREELEVQREEKESRMSEKLPCLLLSLSVHMFHPQINKEVRSEKEEEK